jgi:acyl dehydratase
MRTVAFVQVREWNFREPLFIGDTVRLRSRLMEKTLRGRGRRGELIWYRGVVNQEGKTVQDGTLVTLVEGRAGRRPAGSVPVDESATLTVEEPTAVAG